ncbi:MAG TPA: DUF4249 domain-containing protein [Puia sp.]|jgi:hypothetical protein|nr:DUF4249 domain-containing protein [Puia sp.]
MKKIFIPGAVILAAVTLFSCQKTVHPDLNTASPKLVIVGEVTDGPGPYTVAINRSVGFYSDNDFPAVDGATVKISDNLGVTDTLTETSPGVYTTHVLHGVTGNTYTLSVTVNDTSFTAISTMPAKVLLDSVTFDHSGGRRQKSEIIPQANYQDPAGIKNYYQFALYINGTQFTKDIYAFNDRLTDGRYLIQSLRMDSTYLDPGDLVKVDMYCIDVNVYDYFNQLSRASGTGAFNTAAAPANPATNITGGAYGVFSAHTVSSKTVTVF